MRAAYHGRVQMVRVLLEHGADPNVARNDNFTALSLAAFAAAMETVDAPVWRLRLFMVSRVPLPAVMARLAALRLVV